MNYEDEIFNFLTSEQNYLALVKAKEHFPKVKKRLIENFWTKVFEGLKNHYANNQIWVVKKDSNVEHPLSKVYIYRSDIDWVKSNELPPFLIGWERLSQSYPYYGFWVNEKSEKYDFQKIIEYFRDNKKSIAPEMDDIDGWWGIWDSPNDINFDKEETLIALLPDRLDETANSFVNNIINLEEKMKVHFEEIIKMVK
jgi:hypothetical protein